MEKNITDNQTPDLEIFVFEVEQDDIVCTTNLKFLNLECRCYVCATKNDALFKIIICYKMGLRYMSIRGGIGPKCLSCCRRECINVGIR